jgi:hypothetical protein
LLTNGNARSFSVFEFAPDIGNAKKNLSRCLDVWTVIEPSLLPAVEQSKILMDIIIEFIIQADRREIVFSDLKMID